MKRVLFLLLAATMFVPPLLADRGYSFHLLVTDGRTGLTMNPKFADLKIPEDQLARAAQSTVFSLNRIDGTHWTWTMVNAISPKDGSRPEVGLTDRSSGDPGPASDFSLQLVDRSTVALRCWCSQCAIRVVKRDGTTATSQLGKQEAVNVPSDCDIAIKFTDP